VISASNSVRELLVTLMGYDAAAAAAYKMKWCGVVERLVVAIYETDGRLVVSSKRRVTAITADDNRSSHFAAVRSLIVCAAAAAAVAPTFP